MISNVMKLDDWRLGGIETDPYVCESRSHYSTLFVDALVLVLDLRYVGQTRDGIWMLVKRLSPVHHRA